MKHLIIRTDIKKKLKDARIIVVDSNIFASELDNRTIDELIEILADRDLGHILNGKMKLVLYSNNNNGKHRYESWNKDIIYKYLNGMAFGDFIDEICAMKNVSARNIVLINSIVCDRGELSRVGFSASPVDAPLNVKSNSYYSSNMSGAGAFSEIVDLILKSRS